MGGRPHLLPSSGRYRFDPPCESTGAYCRLMWGHGCAGAVSMIIWIITSLCLIKYALIVLKADGNGQGETASPALNMPKLMS